jgi:Na+-transporting NADH:ubiquinone oxidoreductase subunit A
MSNVIKISKGLDINLEGVADKVIGNSTLPKTIAIKPTDFHGVIPKLTVKEGDEVKAGDTIFYSKESPEVKFASPVSGEIAEVVRGAKRKILEVRILADADTKYADLSVKSGNAEELKASLCNSGLWAFIKQRPYDVIADPSQTPKAIVVSAFNSEPLAADLDFVLHGREADFQAGIDALAKLTSGKVHLNVHQSRTTSSVFTGVKNAQINTFGGAHPSGLVGVQINKLEPINKGEVVWTVEAQRVAMIGKFMREGKYDASILIALTGSMVEKPRYYKTVIGASIKSIVENNINTSSEARYISGTVLTGEQIDVEGYLGSYDNTITVIPEGREPQPFGWIAPNFGKLSMSKSYFSWLTPSKKYDLNTSMNGEERAFVVTGQYEQVFPMDILPQYLIKSIITKNIEQMENLGIYEVAPEDFALCEFVCTSKMELQQIVRGGLDMAKAELG